MNVACIMDNKYYFYLREFETLLLILSECSALSEISRGRGWAQAHEVHVEMLNVYQGIIMYTWRVGYRGELLGCKLVKTVSLSVFIESVAVRVVFEHLLIFFSND